MADIVSIGLLNSIDPLFYFWLAVWYLIILFHSWNIPEIWDKIKGVETLFLAGVLGYFLTQLTRNIIFPVMEIISKTIESGLTNLPLVDLPTVPSSGPGNDIINIVSLELFMLSFSILLFTGAIFFILWVLRSALDPEGIIFKRCRRFREIDKLKINEVIPIYLPRFLIFITMFILFFFEGIIGSIQNIFKLAFSFSSIIDYVYYILFIVVDLIMLFIVFVPIMKDDFKKIKAILSAVAGKINHFHKNYVTLMQSENSNIYLNNLFDKYKYEVSLFIIIWVIVIFLREYKYSRSSIVEIELYFLLFVFVIVFAFLITKFRKKKILNIK